MIRDLITCRSIIRYQKLDELVTEMPETPKVGIPEIKKLVNDSDATKGEISKITNVKDEESWQKLETEMLDYDGSPKRLESLNDMDASFEKKAKVS